MKNKASGAQHTPALVGLGVVLMIGVLFLLFRGPGFEARMPQAPAQDTRVATIAAAKAVLANAVLALETGSDASYAALDESAGRLRNLDTGGLNPDQKTAVGALLTQARTVSSSREARAGLTNAADSLDQLIPLVIDRANNLEQAAIMQNTPIVAAQLERLRLVADGIRGDVARLIGGVGDPALVSQRLLDSEMTISQIVRGFEEGDPELGLRAVSDPDTATALVSLRDVSNRLGASIRDVLAVSDQLVASEAMFNQLLAMSGDIGPVPAMRAAAPMSVSGDAGMQRNILAGLTAAALLLFLIIGWFSYRARDFRKATALQAEQTERNQKAIMRLLDELGSLADGDLTVKATVTEDITGAIADSINYAIEALRELVATLNDSAIRVDGAAKQTDQSAQQLAEAGEAQTKQIEAATDAIMGMAASIEEISGNAERSSDVARHSVDVAHKGGDAVRRTIEGMNTIRETIQDTAKRIKRLGESSQEIGNIVELINDIADQTNILALNASIQASTAGEAGRGFAVVADEVQRLAERSANATKQIEVLVRTIQADTNEAVVSMERSTTDVVGGALLAENAGAALEEIEQVSNQIASLVQNISSSAREQSGAAATVTRNMDRLQEINNQTEASTNATTGSIRELAELAAQLRESVAGFRLPETDAETGETGLPDEDGFVGDLSGEHILMAEEPARDDVGLADQKTA